MLYFSQLPDNVPEKEPEGGRGAWGAPGYDLDPLQCCGHLEKRKAVCGGSFISPCLLLGVPTLPCIE